MCAVTLIYDLKNENNDIKMLFEITYFLDIQLKNMKYLI